MTKQKRRLVVRPLSKEKLEDWVAQLAAEVDKLKQDVFRLQQRVQCAGCRYIFNDGDQYQNHGCRPVELKGRDS